LDSRRPSRAFGLTYEAAVAASRGDRAQAADLIARAVERAGRSDAHALLVDRALAEGDLTRAVAAAAAGFDAAPEGTEAQLVCAALLARPEAHGLSMPGSWTSWRARHGATLATRLLTAALGAVRASR